MRTIKRKTTARTYSVGDKVRTVRGEGFIKCIFPSGPHNKATYAVKLARGRLGVIFDENEISVIRE